MSEVENLLDTVKANSAQLNACDIPQPITVTIQDVRRGPSKEQPVAVHIDGGYQPFMPCKTVRRVLIGAWGANGKDWIGKTLVLFCDESVKFGGVAVGGIRVSHMSHIANDMSFGVNTTRGKKGQITVRKLEVKYYPADKFAENLTPWRTAIAAGKITADQAISKAEQNGKLTDEQKAAIRAQANEEVQV